MALRPIVRALVIPVLGLSLSGGIASHPALAEGDVAAPSSHKVVNIYEATAEEIARLPRVGAKLAGRIVEHRKDHGAFKRPEDLMQVKGVGEKFFTTLKPYVAVSGPTTLVEKASSAGTRSKAGAKASTKTAKAAKPAKFRLSRDEGLEDREGQGLSRSPRPPGRRGEPLRTNGAAPSPLLKPSRRMTMHPRLIRGHTLAELAAVLTILGLVAAMSVRGRSRRSRGRVPWGRLARGGRHPFRRPRAGRFPGRRGRRELGRERGRPRTHRLPGRQRQRRHHGRHPEGRRQARRGPVLAREPLPRRELLVRAGNERQGSRRRADRQTFPQPTASAISNICSFSPVGHASPGTVYLSNRRSRQAAVRVSPTTAKVQIWTWHGKKLKWIARW